MTNEQIQIVYKNVKLYVAMLYFIGDKILLYVVFKYMKIIYNICILYAKYINQIRVKHDLTWVGKVILRYQPRVESSVGLSTSFNFR